MAYLYLAVEVVIVVFASWTVAYEVVLFTRMPARTVLAFFVFFLLLLTVGYMRSWWRYFKSRGRKQIRFFGAVLALGVVVGTFSALSLRPDNDDVNYLHRPLVQLHHLDEPIIRIVTGFDRSDLPPLSVGHVLASYEMFLTFTSGVLHVDPLIIYHNASSFVLGILFVFVYALLYRQLRLGALETGVALLTMLVFLMIDGNQHRSFGNTTLVRLWQGKVVMWAIFIPMTLLMTRRFLSRPSVYNFGLITLISIGVVGLSNSGIFLFPAAVVSVATTYLCIHGLQRKRLQRVVLLGAASTCSALLLLGLVTGVIATQFDPLAQSATFWPGEWWGNLNLVIGRRPVEWLRNLLILLVLPFIALPRTLSRYLLIWIVILIIFFFNPIVGPVWIRILQPGLYWRLAYLLPIPLFAGLLWLPLRHYRRSTRWRIGLVMGVLALIVVALQSSVTLRFKPLNEYKFEPSALKFSREIAGQLSDKNVLAPEAEVVVLALLNPLITFQSDRYISTLSAFRNAGLAIEGERRLLAQQLVTDCEMTTLRELAFIETIHKGVEVVITPCPMIFVQALTNMIDATGEVTSTVEIYDDGFAVLWLHAEALS